ncbi:MAG: (d)CMP kinase [Ignavibacteria bacterium]|nr:(d)CMP kinase [Ignavibacteria bacterium]
MKKIIIAIDGPASSGKSTTARILAGKLGYIYIDTGAMYRAVTHAWLQDGRELNEEVVVGILSQIQIEFHEGEFSQKTFLNGTDISEEIRTAKVTEFVSPVSAMACVRDSMTAMQRKMGEGRGVILDGRDIGTVVFPNAELKIFLIATIEERARRRALEYEAKGVEVSVEEIAAQITARDKYDSSREIAPLRKAGDAIELDTSNLTISEQVEAIYRLAENLLS